MNRAVRDFAVVVFLVLGVGLAVFAYFWFSGRVESGRHRRVVVMFDDVTGMRVGDPVEVMGLPSGKVLSLALSGRRVRCEAGVAKSVRLTEDTRFAIRSVSYLGSDRYLMVTIGEGPEADDRYVYEGANEALNLEETFLKLDRALTAFDPAALGRDIEDRARRMLADVASQIERFGTRLDRFQSGFDATGDELGKLSGSLDTLIGMLEGSSTAGKLLKSDELYQEVRETNQTLKALLDDVKKNPKRYFKVSIF